MAHWHNESLMKDEDFQEDEVWAAGIVIEELNSKVNKSQRLKRNIPSPTSPISSSSSSHACSSINGAGAPRALSKGNKVPHDQQQQKQQQSSAPMRIPEWSKIYLEIHKDSSYACYKDDHDVSATHADDEVMPPHEFINNRVARGQMISTFSMCEGVGRTLKGRDLSKLRNAILTKTGFLE